MKGGGGTHGDVLGARVGNLRLEESLAGNDRAASRGAGKRSENNS